MTIPIIYEDNALIVLEKPAGVVVNRAESVRGSTIQEWAENYLKIPREDAVPRVPRGEEARGTRDTRDSRDIFYLRAGIVHRLDKETSGILLIAKNPKSFDNLQKHFKNREIVKKYITLVHGKTGNSGEIKATVGRLPWNRERFGVLAGGREAETSYKLLKVLKSLNGKLFSLLEITPHTGRTHQIRIHLKYIGHSVVCDSFYAGRKVYREDNKWCPRLFLHASYIKIKHPETFAWMEFRSPLSKDLEDVLKKLLIF